MKLIITSLVLATLIGCGSGRISFPTRVEAPSEKVLELVLYLNKLSPDRKIITTDHSEAKSVVRLSFADIEPLGLSKVSDTEVCEIRIREDVLEWEGKSKFLTTVLHELGHCAGLKHENSQKSIMTPKQNLFFYEFDEMYYRKFFSSF